MLQNEQYHCNTSPAAVTAHIDYETKMILFLEDIEARLWCREYENLINVQFSTHLELRKLHKTNQTWWRTYTSH